MGSLQNNYLKNVGNHFGKSVLWLPTTRVQLGDYGTFVNGQFGRVGNVFDVFGLSRDQHIIPPPADQPEISAIVKSDRSSSTEVRTAASDDSGRFDVNLKVSFRRRSGFIVQFLKMTNRAMFVSQDMRDAIQQAFNDRRWEESYRMVASLEQAQNVKFAYSTNRNAAIELEGKANDPTAGTASLNLDIKSSAEMSTDLWQESGITTPLVDLYGFVPDDFDRNELIEESGKRNLKNPLVLTLNRESFITPAVGLELD